MKRLLFLLVCLLTSFGHAKEGMYLLHQTPRLALEQAGLVIPTDSLWNAETGGISRAVISLGGCTASFVSRQGLIVTNHHCVYRALQRNSTPDSNLLKQGFLAASQEAEVPTYGTNAYVLDSFENVTSRILAPLKENMSATARQKAIQSAKVKLIESEEEIYPHHEIDIIAMDYGLEYILFRSLRITDIRLVYAPPKSIGKFGGDIDNFEWPRHTGDYAFLRAYVGPDGTPADYSPENVPYQPDTWLEVSTKGYGENDFIMVIGYPGRTARYRTAADIHYRDSFYYPWRIDMLSGYIAMLEELSQANDTTALQLESTINYLNNSLKNSKGQYDGLKRTSLLSRKKEQERALLSALASDPDRQKRVEAILTKIDSSYADMISWEPKRYLAYWFAWLNDLYRVADKALTWAEEKTKPTVQRKEGFRDKDIENFINRLKFGHKNFNIPAEKYTMKYFFELNRELAESSRIRSMQNLGIDVPETRIDSIEWTFIDSLYNTTRFTALDEQVALFDVPPKEIQTDNDPLLAFVRRMKAELDPLQEKHNSFETAIQDLRSQYIDVIRSFEPETIHYPDANSSKRISYGTVSGYSPADAVYLDYYTTTDGILEKDIGEEPFDSPESLLTLIRNRSFKGYTDATTRSMHVNFLTTLDTTGGNSGSPVLDAHGRLIGLLFDGNYESIVADYVFDPPYTRSICVDIRYVLWLMEQLDGARPLLEEMGRGNR
jgi:hypothetical protein